MKSKLENKKSKAIIILLLITLLLGTLLRIYKLNEFPAGMNADEAAIGYNAYSLIMTGKDEYGTPWPVHFKSFADYKPGGYFYIVLPFVKFFGLSELSVRLPSALAGVISIVIIFLLVNEVFGNSWIALFSAFFLAISPWHIHFSRGGWETNVATFFILLGIFFFFKFLKRKHFLIFSFLFFLFAIYTYHSARIIVPFLGLSLLFFFHKEIFKSWKIFLISLFVVSLLAIPLLNDFFSPAVSARFSGVGLFADKGPFWQANRLRGEHLNQNSLPVKLLHNRLVTYGLRFLNNYFSHFSGEFLFISGDKIRRSNSPEMGEMYLFDTIFLVVGFYYLFKNKPKSWQIILSWLLIAPIAASLTFQSPHALRSHNMIIPLTIISACGFYQILKVLKGKANLKYFFLLTILIIFVIGFNFSYFLHQYFVHYPKEYPEAWEYGFKELVEYIQPIKDNYNKIYITDKYDQPYILFLFYLKYPPQKFQKEAVLTPRDEFGFSTVKDFSNFHFERINWDLLKDKDNILIIGTEEEIPKEASKIKTIYFKNYQPAFYIIKK